MKSPYQWTGNGPRKIWIADFETTTKEDDCRVWAWGMANVDDPDTVEHGLDIASFIKRVAKLKGQIYFHNAKFDVSFIIDYLLRIGYEHTTEQFPSRTTFTTLMSGGGKLFSCRVKFGNGNSIEFRDSFKKIPLKVADIPKAFHLEVRKGDLDYHKERPIGYEPTDAEWSYIDRDVTIVATAMRQVLSSGMTRLTVASDSLSTYKKLETRRVFERNFPVLGEEVDAFIREAYRGGYTYADKRFSGRLHETRGVVLDVNSLYPHIMYSKSLPYGTPTSFRGTPPKDGKLHIFSVTFTAKLKPNHIPIIQIKRNVMFGGSEYLTEIPEPTQMHVTDDEWKLFNEHYDIDVHAWHGGYGFYHRVGMFDKYIDKYMDQKEHSVGGQRQIAKLYLNSLYGKFATNPNVTGKDPYFEDDRVKWRRGAETMRDPIYTAAGVFITAYARELTIRAAQANYGTFAYADTDSLHLMRPDIPDSIDVHPTRLGAWKHEYDFKRAFYMRAKAYMEETLDGRRETHIAGVPLDVGAKLTFDDLYPGKVIHGKLTPKTVPGGVVLVDTPFMLQFDASE